MTQEQEWYFDQREADLTLRIAHAKNWVIEDRLRKELEHVRHERSIRETEKTGEQTADEI